MPLVLVLATGCTGRQTPQFPGLDRAQASVPARRTSDRMPETTPAAIVDGLRIDPAVLQPAMAEAAGAVALEEAILDRLLDREIARVGIALTPADAERESRMLLETVAEEARLLPDQAAAAVERLRRERGFGPTRYPALLARNAKLRRLVSGEDPPTPGEVQSAIAVEFGERVALRLASFPTRQQASDAHALIISTPSGPARDAAFAAIASDRSLDPSAPLGGLYEGVSPSDPAVAPSIRGAIETLAVGESTPVLVVDRGFAVVLLRSRTAASAAPTPAQASATEARVARRKERQAMDRLARRLLAGAGVTVFDDSLRWGWESRPGR